MNTLILLLFVQSALATTGATSSLIVDKEAVALSEKLAIKVLTITTFELGEITGDKAGEAQLWFEREKLTKKYLVPGAFSPLYCNDKAHCLIVTGMSTANAAASLMAVGLNPYIDLKSAYLLVAGIAGGNPADTTVGGAVWATWIVGSDDRHHIDYRELPKGWRFTNFHLGCTEPWCTTGWASGNEVYSLDSKVVERAVQLSKDVVLADNDAVKAYRHHFKAKSAARREPFVTRCDILAGGEYFHGAVMSAWATWWIDKWTAGKGRYCATDMEDTGLLAAATRLAEAKLVDMNRILVLRTISNFDQPYPGEVPIRSLKSLPEGIDVGTENAYRVGSKVVHHILDNWDTWKDGVR